MSEYKHTVAKTQQKGFAQSPEQAVGNSGNSRLDDSLTLKNGVILTVAYSQGKKVFNAGSTAIIGQIGNSRLEEGILAGQKIAGYALLGVATGGTTVLIAATAEALTLGITTLVDNHAINLDNDRIRKTRGSLINFSGADFYG